MGGSPVGEVVAAVAFDAPHGRERRTLAARGGVLVFGRLGTCDIRLGHAPVRDEGVPRAAGRLVALGPRVAVENLDDMFAFEVATRDGARSAVRPRELFSPASNAFDIILAGSCATYRIHVAVAERPVTTVVVPIDTDDAEPLTTSPPQLTAAERSVLDAYLAPLRAGRPLRATHLEAAEALGRSKTWVRDRASDIYDKFLFTPIPMKDFPDAVDAIVDAAWRHGL
jgi:hypothetical protein